MIAGVKEADLSVVGGQGAVGVEKGGVTGGASHGSVIGVGKDGASGSIIGFGQATEKEAVKIDKRGVRQDVRERGGGSIDRVKERGTYRRQWYRRHQQQRWKNTFRNPRHQGEKGRELHAMGSCPGIGRPCPRPRRSSWTEGKDDHGGQQCRGREHEGWTRGCGWLVSGRYCGHYYWRCGGGIECVTRQPDRATWGDVVPSSGRQCNPQIGCNR